MSNKLFPGGGVFAGSTSVSIPVVLRSTTNNTEVTGKVYTDVTASYLRQGGTRTAITTATLAAIDSAYSSGGFKEADSTNQPGLYRFDIPDAAFASGADWVVISLNVSGAYLVHERFEITPFSVNSSGRVDVGSWLGTAVTTSSTTSKPQVDAYSISDDATAANNLESAYDGTGYVFEDGTAQAGASGSITLAAGSSSTNDYYKGTIVYAVAGTGAGQCRLITAYNGTTKVATISPNWATNPDNTTKYIFQPWGYVESVVGAVGSVTGAVGSVTGAVGSVTGAVGSVTGNVGGNVVGSVASVSGNVGGNVTGSVGSVATGGISSTSFASGAITATSIASNAITADKIATDAITTSQLADGTITAAKIASDAITAAKIAADAIASTKIADGAITAAKLAADAITAAKVAADVTTEIQSGLATASAVSALDAKIDIIDTNVEKVLDDTGTSGVIVATNSDKTGYSLASSSITSSTFAANSVTASALASDAASEVASAVIVAVIESEGSYTIKQALSILLAACAGVTADAGLTFKTPNGNATRIAATVNGSDERTAVTLTPSS